MDKKIIILGIAGAVAGYLLLSRSGSEDSGAPIIGGGAQPPAETPIFEMPLNITFPDQPFPMFDFSLPDPNNYNSDGSGSDTFTTKKGALSWNNPGAQEKLLMQQYGSRENLPKVLSPVVMAKMQRAYPTKKEIATLEGAKSYVIDKPLNDPATRFYASTLKIMNYE